jgi:enoyl-[acyl-carrier protein] reductase I
MAGKRGLIMGVANDHSIAWGIARAVQAQGARLAFTYQGEAVGKRVKPLAASVGSSLVLPADVTDEPSLDALFAALGTEWGSLDFVVHAIAYSDKRELKGRYVDTSRENFRQSLDVSCFSFTDIARRASALMPQGGSLLTLSYAGAERVMPNYNVMGVAKAALEASVRYLAADLGRDGIRVNALSAGPMRTLAGSAIADARTVFRWNRIASPLHRNMELDDVGGAALYLLSDLSAGVTGEIHHVDGGYNIIGMPQTQDLAELNETGNGNGAANGKAESEKSAPKTPGARPAAE